MSLIETVAVGGLFQVSVDRDDVERSGDLLASERARASAAFRRIHQMWPDAFEQTVDGQPAYPRR